MLRPTLQGRAGFNPNGHGPGVGAPFGVSASYLDGKTRHNGQDYFWLGAASATRLGISTAASKGVYPVVNGPIVPVSNAALGNGFYQQINASHRAYFWHLAAPVAAKTLKVTDRAATMGATGTATSQVHLHFEIRKAPYNMADRVNPEPFFVVVTEAQKARYRKIGAFLNLHAANLGLPRTRTASDGMPGGNYWKLVQGLGRAWRFYDGAVDGVPGRKTYAAESNIWAAHVNVVAAVANAPTVVDSAVPEATGQPDVVVDLSLQVEPEPTVVDESTVALEVSAEPAVVEHEPNELELGKPESNPNLTGWAALAALVAIVVAAVASFFGVAL